VQYFHMPISDYQRGEARPRSLGGRKGIRELIGLAISALVNRSSRAKKPKDLHGRLLALLRRLRKTLKGDWK